MDGVPVLRVGGLSLSPLDNTWSPKHQASVPENYWVSHRSPPTHTDIYTDIHKYAHIDTHTKTHTDTHVQTHTDIHRHTDTQTHTQMIMENKSKNVC